MEKQIFLTSFVQPFEDLDIIAIIHILSHTALALERQTVL